MKIFFQELFFPSTLTDRFQVGIGQFSEYQKGYNSQTLIGLMVQKVTYFGPFNIMQLL